MTRQPSLFQRGVEPLVHALWPLFIGWSAVVAGLWWMGDDWVTGIRNSGLRAAVDFIVHSADATWLLLAALNAYLGLAEREGIRRARVLALGIITVAAAIAWSSVVFGQPLGKVVYTARLGARLGPVPVGWLLLWLVAVLSSRALVARLAPRLGHGALSLAVGGVALVTDFNLEPIATRLRSFWFWYVPGTTLPAAASWQNFAVWFATAAALAWWAREHRVAAGQTVSIREASIIVIVNGVLLTGHLRL